ncbi:MAG: protein kinase [Phycisphaerales bacterium]|nr:protein kinase [Phycisphaerales bacterium]
MSSCPPKQTLRAFERGELTDVDAAPIEAHMGACDACRARLEKLRSVDPDTRFLRGMIQESRVSAIETAAAAPALSAAPGSRTMPDAGEPAFLPAPDARTTGVAEEASAFLWSIPDYERVQLCGEGAFGSVWAVRDRVGVFRALKIIDMAKMSRAKVSCRESTALETYCRRVGRHPYLIDVYHVGIVAGQLYYTMELADNDLTKEPVETEFPRPYRPLTLQTVIRRRRITPDTAIEIARRLLRGLAKLHHLDLVHRDIKPANIVFVKRRPKLADIGMITIGADGNTVTGTPRYMPPDRRIDKTADTFAIGKVLHEMMSGAEARTFPALPLDQLGGSLKWDLAKVSEVIARACSPGAADRYPSASEMLDDLEACADFPFPALFDEGSDPADAGPSPRPALSGQLLLAAIRAIPWLVGLIAFVLALDRLLPKR